jgi:hypothetical protein
MLVMLFTLSSCSSDTKVVEEEAPSKTSCQTSPASDSGQEETGASENVTRPRVGDYVYDFCGLGDTHVPAGTKFKEHLTTDGDLYTIEVTNNLNGNSRRYQIRWEGNRVVQTSNATTIGGQRRACEYQPPLEILHVPIRVESFASQKTDAALCAGTVDVTVLGRQSVRDASRRKWSTWVIEISTRSGARTDEERHWFSTELGRDIRLETRTEESGKTDQTAQLLRSYPGS